MRVSPTPTMTPTLTLLTPAVRELGVHEFVLDVLQLERAAPAVVSVGGRLRVDVRPHVRPHTHACGKHEHVAEGGTT